MATLAEVLRGYTPPTESALADPIKEHFRTLPQQLATNQQAMDNTMASMYKTDMATGQPNPNYRPEAMNEFTQMMPMVGALTAWHGTPHKIQGAFDISKVGTGEGNQTFSHGMYFAEAPAVATQYRDALSDFDWKFGGKPYDINNPSHRAAIELKQLGGNVAKEETIKRYENNIADLESRGVDWAKNAAQKKKEELAVLKTGVLPQLEEISKGNLYKVDIPDEYLPNMLHWDKPLTEQSPQVKKALESLGIKTDKQKLNEFDNALLEALTGDARTTLPNQPKNPLGSEVYERLLKGDPASKSAKLNELGIKGVSYLDEGSRGWRMLTPEESTSGKYVVGKHPGGGPEQKYFDNLKEAQDYYNKNQTRNHVVFEPSQVKILEENGIPTRKELIQQQIDKLE